MKMRVWYSSKAEWQRASNPEEKTNFYFYPVRSSREQLLGLVFTNNAKAFGFTWWDRKNFLDAFTKVEHWKQNDYFHWAIMEAFEDVETQYGLEALSK
jgi:hypothetical protein